MKKIVLRIISAIAAMSIITPMVGAADTAKANIKDDDSEVKTYYNEIGYSPSKLADDGGRLRISAWDFAQMGGEVNTIDSHNKALEFRDTSSELPVTGERKFEAATYGELDWYFEISIGGGITDGTTALRSGENNAVLLGYDGQWIWAQTPVGKKELMRYKEDVSYLVYAHINLDTKKLDIYIDHKRYARNLDLLESNVDNFYISTGNKSTGTLLLERTNFSLKRGYWIDETFGRGSGSILPADWKMKTTDTSGNASDASVYFDSLRGITVDSKSGRTELTKTFENKTRDFTTEFYLRQLEGCNSTYVELSGKGNTVLKLSADNNSFYYQDASGNNIKFYDKYKKDLFYIFWADVKFSKGTFDLYLEDKKIVFDAPLAANAKSVDTFKAVGEKNSGTFHLSEVKIYPIEKIDDYVPKPQKVSSDGVDIGMQYFGLWNEGGLFGWDWVNDSDFRRPLDGFYDEDSPEHWDWQIKYWVEHGISYVAPCWYARGEWALASEKVRTPFFKAKYSNQMKYALLMETKDWGNWTTDKAGADKWLNDVGRQMIEYYFKDDRYYTNGGRPVVFMFGWEQFRNAFGANIDYVFESLDKMCEDEKIGKPMFIMHFGDEFEKWTTSLEEAQEINADGFFHYSLGRWPEKANEINATHAEIANTSKNKKGEQMVYVPTVSQGFDNYAWNDEVGYDLDGKMVEKSLKLCQPILDKSTKGTELTPMLNLATWNEYGEGHYFSPSTGYGFSMLDAVRDVYVKPEDNVPHNDITPTEKQQDRFNNLYPAGRTTRVREKNVGETPAETAKSKYLWEFNNSSDLGWKEMTTVPGTVDNGVWKLSTDGNAVIKLTDAGVDTSAVTHIRIRMKNKSSAYQISTDFKTKYWNTAQQNRTIHTYLWDRNKTDSDGFSDVYIPVGEYTEFWRGVLEELEFQFVGSTAGEAIDIESIAFMALPRSKDISVWLDGYTSDDDVQYDKDGIPMLPLRSVTEKWRGQVYYDNLTGKTYVKNGEDMTVFVPGDDNITINGVNQKIRNTAYIDDGKMWVNAELLAAMFSKYAIWDPNAKLLSLTDKSSEYIFERDNSERKKLWSEEFDTLGNILYTKHMDGLTVSDGVASYTVSGDDPQFAMNIPSADLTGVKCISVGIKTSKAFNMQIFYQTTNAVGISEEHSMWKNVPVTDDVSEVVIDVSAIAGFSGKLTWMRLDSGDQAGTECQLDYIRVYGDYETAMTEEELAKRVDCRTETSEGIVWNFDVNTKRDGWAMSKSLANAKISGGVLTADVINRKPFFVTEEANLGIDTSNYDKVSFCIRNATPSILAKVYFITKESPAWSEDKCVEVSVEKNDALHMAYTADMSSNPAWSGTLKGLRIELTGIDDFDEAMQIGLDFVKVLKNLPAKQ